MLIFGELRLKFTHVMLLYVFLRFENVITFGRINIFYPLKSIWGSPLSGTTKSWDRRSRYTHSWCRDDSIHDRAEHKQKIVPFHLVESQWREVPKPIKLGPEIPLFSHGLNCKWERIQSSEASDWRKIQHETCQCGKAHLFEV